jgi:hypothetical protein
MNRLTPEASSVCYGNNETSLCDVRPYLVVNERFLQYSRFSKPHSRAEKVSANKEVVLLNYSVNQGEIFFISCVVRFFNLYCRSYAYG